MLELTPDMVNGSFELFGGFLYMLNIHMLYKSKEVKGVSLLPTVFFSSWGLWNLFYYPSLEQWFSFFGGIVLVTVNTIWLTMAYYYNKKAKINESI